LLLATNTHSSKRLDAIFQVAFGIVSTCFTNDLPARVLERDNGAWEVFMKEVADSRIPLPQSNTLDAKRMRTAAVLRFLAKEAVAQLFQPSYTLKHGSELSDVLHERIDDDDHTNFVRRVLLRTEPVELEETHVKARATAVEDAVKKAVSGILSRDADDVFLTALSRWCYETACEWHANIQPLRDSLRAHIDLDDDDLVADEWCVLAPTPEWAPKSTRASANGNSGSNSTRSTANGDANGDANGGASARPTVAAAAASQATATNNTLVANINDVAAYVWPLFITNGSDVAQNGLVVTKTQVAQAQREVGTLAMQQNSVRRNGRAIVRSQTSNSRRTPNTPTATTNTGGRPF
jgi:hypothetical protein